MQRGMWGVFITCLVANLVFAQTQPNGSGRSWVRKAKPPEAQQFGDRGPHWQTVTNLVPVPDDTDGWRYQTNTYVHLEPGLNYRDAQGQWIAAKEQFELLPQGAVARQGQHQVTLQANLNGNQPVSLVLPDGQVLTSRPHGLAYYDTATGEAVLLAEIKDCQGFQIAPNQILYTDAFDDIQADVRYTYTKGAFEQDIVLKQAPPAPEKYGLNSATTRLEVWSEFLSAPTPSRLVNVLKPGELVGGRDESFTDDQLDFGAMKMGAGRAFQAGTHDESSVPVGKSWIQDQGRTFLIEAVELPAIQPDLQVLPQTPGGAVLKRKPGKRETALRQLPVFNKAAKREQAAIRPATKELLAALIGPALVLDYSILNAGTLSASYVFKGDTTYFINGQVSTVTSTNAATTFEGGAVFKYNSGVSAILNVKTPIVWQASPYRPIVFTAKDDNSVGDSISGSSGTPMGSYASAALSLDGTTSGANSSFTLANVRVSYAQIGIGLTQLSSQTFSDTISHAQFVYCGTAIAPTNAIFNLRNALVANAGTVFAGTASKADVQHLTVDTATTLYGSGTFSTAANLTLHNSLLTGFSATPVGSYTGGSDVMVVTLSSGIFQAVGGGAHYLATTSPYRNVGSSVSTSIDPALVMDFQHMTTYAPDLLPTTLGVTTKLSPVALPDTDTPDLGYHYPVLDYLAGSLTLNKATLMLTNGVAVGFYGTGITLQSGAKIYSQGRPEQLNRLTPLNSVQELPQAWINASTAFTLFGGTPTVTLRFTDVSFLSGPSVGRTLQPAKFNAVMTLTDSQLRGVSSMTTNYNGSGFTATKLLLTNCLVERSMLQVEQGSYYGSSPYYVTLAIRNCLFSRSGLTMARSTSSYGIWTITDNLFDGTSPGLIYFSGSTPVDSLGYNAFVTATTDPFGSISTDKLGLLRDFVSGPLGDYYYPTNSTTNSLSILINAGSRSASSAGFYHYTTRQDQKKDAALTAGIGYHYVATTAYSASGGYSGTQGANGWSYLRSTALRGSTWAALPKYGNPQSGYNNVWYDDSLTGANWYTWIWSNSQIPGQNYDSVRLFTVPQGGVMTIWSQANNYSPCGGDGVALRVALNGTSLTPWTTVPTNSTWVTVNTGSMIAVNDQLAFQVNLNSANNYCDNTIWDPLITLNQPVDTDGDTIADYVEDPNGNGNIDSNETNWQYADSDSDGRSDFEERNDGTNPFDAQSVKHIRLSQWFFDDPTPWTGGNGQLPLVNSYSGISSYQTTAGFSGKAASFVFGTDPATSMTARMLTYKWIEGNQRPNITLQAGSFRLWFKPSWASSTASGSGPGAEARLVNIGAPVAGTSVNGWWAIYVEANGNQLTVGSQAPGSSTQVKLSADISWKANAWHFIDVAYNNQATTIYIDGTLAKTGAPVTTTPNSNALNQGFAVGTALDGSLPAKGQIDRLETYNYAQTEAEAGAEYRAVMAVDTDNDLLSDVLENQIGTDPTLADTDKDGMPDGWEYRYGFNPLSPQPPTPSDHEATLDADSDGASNLAEYLAGTDPRNNEGAIRLPLLPVSDPYDKAQDQQHLVNIDLGQSKSASGPKAAGYDPTSNQAASDQWDVIVGGDPFFLDSSSVASGLLSGIALHHADGSDGTLGIWSGFGPVTGKADPKTGTISIPCLGISGAISVSCLNSGLTPEQRQACIDQSTLVYIEECLGRIVSPHVEPHEGADSPNSLTTMMEHWPSFWNTKGFFLAGIDALAHPDPAAGTIDDVLNQLADGTFLRGLADKGFDTGGASTRTVIYGLSNAKYYRLYIKGIFSGVVCSSDVQLGYGGGSDPNARYIGDVAGTSRYLLKPQTGAVTLLDNSQLAYLQVVELDSLPAPVILVQATPTTKPLVGYGMCRLEWLRIPTAEAYAVFRREGAVGDFVQVGTSTALGFIDGGLKDGTTYQYQVVAKNEAYTSPRSTTVTIVTPGANSNSRNHAPSLQRPDPIQFAERNSTFRLSMPRLQAETKAVDVDGDSITFRIDSVPAGQIVKKNSVNITPPVDIKAGDIIEWTAPNVTSEQGIIAFYVSAFDGFQTSVNSVPVPIVVKPPSVLYGWGYSGLGNLAQGKGMTKVDVWWSNPDPVQANKALNRYYNLYAGNRLSDLDIPYGFGSSTTSNGDIHGSASGAITAEPVALEQLTAGAIAPIRSVLKVTGGQRIPRDFSGHYDEFGINNAVMDNSGKVLVWGMDSLTGMFGEGEMEQYTGVERPAFWDPNPDQPFRSVKHRYIYDAAIPFGVTLGGTLKQWDSLTDLSVSYQHALAADASGHVYSWGADSGAVFEYSGHLSRNKSIGYLGLRGSSGDYLAGTDDLGEVKVAHAPQVVQGLDNVIQVVADDVASVALRRDGSVWYWGEIIYSNLVPMDSNLLPDKANPKRLRFSGLSDANAPKITQIAGSRYHFVALDQNGEVWEFGYLPRLLAGGSSSVSPFDVSSYREQAEKVPGLSKIQKVATGGNYSLALKSDGTVMEWGELYWFESDSDRHWSKGIPVPVQNISAVTDIAVSRGRIGYGGLGFDHSTFALACDQMGRVWAWGVNDYGELGVDDRSAVFDRPQQVLGMEGATSVFAGQYAAYAVARFDAVTPVSLKAVAGNQRVQLSWRAFFNATDYVIERTSQIDVATSFVQVGVSRDHNFADLTVVNDQHYWYRVRARVDNGSGPVPTDPSAVVAAYPTSPPGVTPDGLVVIPECKAIEVRWNVVSSATGYRIYRTGGGISGQTLLGETGAETLYFVDRTVTVGSSYAYLVAAINTGGMGPVSVATTAVGPDPNLCPPAPLSLAATTPAAEQITIQWQEPSLSSLEANLPSGATASIDHYVIKMLYKDSKGTHFSKIADAGSADSSYDYAGIEPGIPAFYTVSLVARILGNGPAYTVESDNATPVEAMAYGAGAAAGITGLVGTGIKVLPDGDSTAKVAAYLTWNDDPNADYYEVQRSTISGNFTGAATIRQGDHRYLDTTVVAGTTYYYQVHGVANNSGTWSWATQPVSVSVPASGTAGAIAVPQVILQSFGYDGRVLLKWPPQPWPAVQYPSGISFLIGRMLPTAPGYRAISVDPPAYGLSLVDDNVLNGTSYTYRTLAFDSSGALLSWSDITAPVTPSSSGALNLVAVAGNGYVKLSWNDLGASAYKIRYSTEPGGRSTLLPEVRGASTSVHRGLNNGQTLYYTVTASIDGAGDIQTSGEVSATPLGTLAPLPPDNIYLSFTRPVTNPQNNASSVVTWRGSDGASGYQVQRALGTPDAGGNPVAPLESAWGAVSSGTFSAGQYWTVNGGFREDVAITTLTGKEVWYRVRAIGPNLTQGDWAMIHKTFIPPNDLNATQPGLGTVTLIAPVANASIITPTNIVLRAVTTLPNITRMDFYDGDTLIGVAQDAPWQFTWNSVPSGSKQLRAYATDINGDGQYSPYVIVNVTWATPLNDYTASATDLTIPTPGPMLAVDRSYNSGRIGELGALGLGWQASWDRAKLVIDNGGDLTVGWSPGKGSIVSPYSIVESMSHQVSITLPSGEVVAFVAQLFNPENLNPIGRNSIELQFAPLADEDGKLTCPHMSSLAVGSASDVGVDWMMTGPLTMSLTDSLTDESADLFLTQGYEFTYVSGEGTTYVFHNYPQTGDTWKLSSMTDRNGHSLTYLYDGSYRLTDIKHDVQVSGINHRNISFVYSTSGANDTISVYDPIESAKVSTDTTKMPAIKYVITTISSARLLTQVHRLAQRKTASVNERYEVLRYTYGALPVAEALNRLTVIEAGLTRYGSGPVAPDVADISAMTWFQVLGNTYSNIGTAGDATYGKLSAQSDASGHTTSLQVNPTTKLVTTTTTVNGTVSGTTDGHTVIETATQDASGMVTDVNQAGITTSTHYKYDDKGRIESESDPAGNVKTYHYDKQNRLTGVTDGAGNGGNSVFNQDGSLYSTQDADGNATFFTYDGNGNLSVSQDATGTITTRFYYPDAKWAGLVQRESRQVPGILKPLVTDYEYTDQGDILRVVNYIDPATDAPALDASRTGYRYSETEYPQYDGNGNRLQEKRWRTVSGVRQAAITSYGYDAQNRTLTTDDPLYVSGTLHEGLTTYDVFGRAIATRDPLGRITQMYYDANGNLIQTIYPDGTLTRTIFDERNRPRFVQSQLVPANLSDCQSVTITSRTTGPGTETLYDAAGRAVGSRRWANFTVQKAPTSSSQVATTLTDASGTVLSAVTGTPDSTTRTVYDDAGRIKYSINANGAVSESVYDTGGRVTMTRAYLTYQVTANDFSSTIAPTGSSLDTAFGYDDNGNRMWVMDAKSQAVYGSNAPETALHQMHRTDFRYDEGNRQTLVRYPLVDGDSERKWRQTVYDGEGRRNLAFDEAGVATAYAYDNLGRLTSVINDYQSGVTPTVVTAYEYDEVGNMTKQTDAKTHVTTFEYDSMGRRTKRTLPAITSETGVETVTYTDVLASGSVYVEQRQIVTFNGRRLTFKDDQMGRLSLKTLEIPSWTTEATVNFTYYPIGWLRKVSETRGSASRYTFFKYDGYGRLVKKDSPEGVLTYQYLTASGALDTIKGYARAAVSQPATPATAQDANDLIGTEVPDVSLKYEYDLLGRLQKVSDLDGTTGSFTTDSPKTIYSYDANGNIDSVRYPENSSARVEQKYAYTAQNRLKQLDLRRVNSTSGTVVSAVMSYQYQLNANGRRTAIIEDDQPATVGTPRAVLYAYDTDDTDNTPGATPDPVPLVRLNRLSQELVTTYDEGPQTFTDLTATSPYAYHKYDVVGNRTYSKQKLTAASAITLTPAYDNRDRLEDASPGGANSNYDANGNTLTLLQTTLGDPSFNETPNTTTGNLPAGDTYDSENRLVKRVFREVIAGDANDWKQTTIDLVYDHAGNRVAKKITAETRLKASPYTLQGTAAVTNMTYLVDELNPTGYAQVLADYQQLGAGSVTLQRNYAYGLDLISQEITGTTTRDYYGYDGLGSVRHLLTVAGARVMGSGTLPDYTYDAYGKLLTTTDTSLPPRNLYRFAGEQWDPDLGLSYNRARYLSPSTGRFWSMDNYEGDSTDPVSLHKYLYANADPINMTDPSGRFSGSVGEVSSVLGTQLTSFVNTATSIVRTYQKISSVLDTINSILQLVEALRSGQIVNEFRQVASDIVRHPEWAGIDFNEAAEAFAANMPQTIATGLPQWSSEIAAGYVKGNRISSWLLYMPTPFNTRGNSLKVRTGISIGKTPLKLAFGGKSTRLVGGGFVVGASGKVPTEHQLFRMDINGAHPRHGNPNGTGARPTAEEIDVFDDLLITNRKYHFHVNKLIIP